MRDARNVVRRLPPLLAVATAALVLVTSAGARQAVTITITSGPSGTTTATAATFAWALSGADAGRVTRVVCTLGRTITDPCRSPQSYSGLEVGNYTFGLRAYAGSTDVGSASRSWTIQAAGAPPTPTPPPPPPPKPGADLKAPKTVQPGALAVLDASAVMGGGTAYEFDLDGNGAYETKCGKEPTVGAVYPQGGTKSVAVKVTGPGGVATANAKIVVAGGAVPAPKGGGAGLGQVALTAVCNGSDLAAAAVKAYTCPATVVVGVAEATIPAGAPASACFTRTKLLDERFKAPAGQPVYVNGLFVRPDASSQVMLRVFQKTKTVGLTKGGAQVSAYLKLPEIDVDGGGPFLWNVAGPGVVGELGAGADDSFLGLPVPDQAAPITFTAGRQARVGVRVGLPKPLDGVASGVLQLETDNTSGPVLSSFVASFGDIPIGFDSFVSDAKLTYKTVGVKDVWSGGFRLGLAPAGVSPVVSSALEITDGALTRAEVTIEKQNPGYGPVGCCVFLTRLKGSYKGPDAKYGEQSAFTVEADLTAGPKIFGLSVAKLSAAGTLKVACCGVAVEISGNLYLLEKFKLASGWAYFVTGTSNTFVNVEGSADWDMIVFTAKGTVSGSFGDFTSTVPVPNHWYLGGSVDLCVKFVDLCAGGKLGASNKGAAGCLYIDTPGPGGLAAGGVYYWDGGWGTFWGCSKQKIKNYVGAPATQSLGGETTATAVTVRVPPGQVGYLFAVEGVGDAPRVALTGPGGRRIVTPAAGRPATDRRSYLVAVVPKERTTYIDVVRPAAGNWRVEPLPGSVPIRRVGVAGPLPTRIAKGSLKRSASGYELRYQVATAPDQRVAFVETAGRTRRLLAETTGAKGRVSFRPAVTPAPVRSVDALVYESGLLIREERIASFRVSSVLPAPRVSLSRSGHNVRVRWTAAPGTMLSVVRVAIGDGRRLLFRQPAGATSLALRRVPSRAAVSAQVRLVSATGTPGRARTARLSGLAAVRIPSSISRSTLRAKGLSVRCALPAAGRCTARLLSGSRLLGSSAAAGTRDAVVTTVVRLSTAGRTRLGKAAGSLLVEVELPGQGVSRTRIRLT